MCCGLGRSCPESRPFGRAWPGVATALLLVAGCGVLAGSAQAAQVSDARAKEIVDAQRVAIGAPATTRFDVGRSEGCRVHGDYLALHPEQYLSTPHDEDPAKNGYTDAGRDAARTSNLVDSADLWRANADPFADGAPWHEMSLLDPWAGPAFWRGASSGKDCIGVGSTLADPAPPEPELRSLLAWPGDGARIPASTSSASEGPYPPNRLSGIPDSQITSPWLMVYSPLLAASFLPDSSCTAPTGFSATLTGPGGALPLVAVTQSSRGSAGETPYLSNGALVASPTPLRADAPYTLTATVARPERVCSFNGQDYPQEAVAPATIIRHFSTVTPTTVSPDFRITANGLTVDFDASSTSSTGSPVADYAWDDGADGTIEAHGVTRRMTYPSPGTCRVSMTATTADGVARTTIITLTLSRSSVVGHPPMSDPAEELQPGRVGSKPAIQITAPRRIRAITARKRGVPIKVVTLRAGRAVITATLRGRGLRARRIYRTASRFGAGYFTSFRLKARGAHRGTRVVLQVVQRGRTATRTVYVR